MLTHPATKIFCWAVRIALVGMLLIGLIWDLPQLEGKGWVARSLFYPISLLIVPALSRFSKNRIRYTHLADGLMGLPFALDIFGNIADLFDTMENFDDVLHALNWIALVASFCVLVATSSTVGRLNLWMLGSGFGALTIVAWEIVEWIVMQLGTERLFLTYGDTIGDLTLSTSGGIVGATIVAFAMNRS